MNKPKKRTKTNLGRNLETNKPLGTTVKLKAITELVCIQFEDEYRTSLPVISRKYDVMQGEKFPNYFEF